jgi:catechol 2,3-dioxygenase-like lactoylglutathione lyase family enzyme
MAEARVTALRSVEMGVRDVAAAAKFYTDVWNLTPVAEADGPVYLRGTGPEQYILGLHRRPQAELVRINLAVPGEAEVDALFAKAKAYPGLGEVQAPAALKTPGGGYGFAFKDVEGRNIGIVAGVQEHADATHAPDRPYKLSHCVLNTGDTETSITLFTDLLGFTVIDRTRMLCFMHCNADHHSIAFGYKGGATLHHIAFEVPDLDSVMRGAARVRDAGFPIEWGVGRHGPGNNVFTYHIGPENFVIEYTSEVEQVDDSYTPGGPNDWGFPPGRTDRWGVTAPPSKRIEEVHNVIGFADALTV